MTSLEYRPNEISDPKKWGVSVNCIRLLYHAFHGVSRQRAELTGKRAHQCVKRTNFLSLWSAYRVHYEN